MAQTLQKIYSDIDFTFTKIPGKKDVAVSYDEMAVIRSVRNLLLTKPYERPFNPGLGSSINALLFEPITVLTTHALKTEIENTINNFEPRVKLKQVNVEELPDQNAYNIGLEFFIGNRVDATSVTLILERTR
jgi:phage baseplate assembly protein W